MIDRTNLEQHISEKTHTTYKVLSEMRSLNSSSVLSNMMTHLIVVGSPKVPTPPSIEFLTIGPKTYLFIDGFLCSCQQKGECV
jgi:hypothetical protein